MTIGEFWFWEKSKMVSFKMATWIIRFSHFHFLSLTLVSQKPEDTQDWLLRVTTETGNEEILMTVGRMSSEHNVVIYVGCTCCSGYYSRATTNYDTFCFHRML